MRIVRPVLLLGAALLPFGAQAQGSRVPDRASAPIYRPVLPDNPDARVSQRPAGQVVTSLPEAIALTYWSNPALLAQRAMLRSTDNRLPLARSAFGPSLSAQLSHGYQRDRREIQPDRFVRQDGWTTTASAILTQPIYTSGRLRSAQNQSLAEIAFERDSLRLFETQTLLDSTNAYVSVQRDTALLAIARENLALLQRQYADNRDRYEVRDITVTDLQQVETRLELAKAQVIGAEGQLGISRSRFVQVIGALPGDLASPSPLPVTTGTLEDAYAYGELHSPVYRAAQSREKISRAVIDAAMAEFGPQVDLRGRVNLGTLDPYSNNLRTETYRGEVVLSQQLFDSGLRNAQVRGAREANQADWRLIDAALRDTRQAIAASWDQLSAARASLTNYRRAEDAARRAYAGAVEQERAGARTTLDVLDLARDLLNVRTSYVTVLANEYLSRAALLAAMGQLTPETLAPDLDRYDPTEHFDKVRAKGGLPLVSPLLSTLDGLTTRNKLADRENRDPAGSVRSPAQMPLAPQSQTPPLVAHGIPVVEPSAPR